MCAKLYISQIKWANCTHFSYNPIEKTKFIAFSIVNKIKKDFNWIATGKVIFNRYFGESQHEISQARKGRNASKPKIVLKKNEKIIKKSSSHR